MKTPIHLTLGLAVCLALTIPVCAQNPVPSARPDTTQPDTLRTFTKVDIESKFPGGSQAWLTFLNAHLRYPDKAVRKKIEGTVVLQFIVDKDGSIIDLQPLSGYPILQEAAMKAMAYSPKWIPAEQNGRKVKSYKKQPIVFSLNP